jgi:hypothetical protein
MKNSKPVYDLEERTFQKIKIVRFVFETLILLIICFLRFVFWNFLPKRVMISEIRYLQSH